MDSIIVCFHVGRGGKFNNQGYKTFCGEKNFQEVINENDDKLFSVNRDKNRFCKLHYNDCSGNTVIEEEDARSLTGTLDFDGEYDTYVCKYVEKCDDEELEIIAKSRDYKSENLLKYLKENTEYYDDLFDKKEEEEEEEEEE